MLSTQLTQNEQEFVNRHGRQITDVVIELANFHAGLVARQTYPLGNRDARIIRKIRPIVGGIEDDVEEALHQISYQVFDCQRRGVLFPVADVNGERVPVVLANYERLKFDGDVTTLSSVLPQLSLSVVDPLEALRLVANPLSSFLAVRWGRRQSSSAGTIVDNAEVTNTQSGWYVIYSPSFTLFQNNPRSVFGGPTKATPLRGHVQPGLYTFGVTQAGNDLWETNTHWPIPSPAQLLVGGITPIIVQKP
jgi:hypothetical protein